MKKKQVVRLPRKYELEAMGDAMVVAWNTLEHLSKTLPLIADRNVGTRDLVNSLLSGVNIALVPFREGFREDPPE